MTRWLVLLVVVLGAAFAALIIWPREQRAGGAVNQNTPGSTGSAAGTADSGPASFTVLVDGQEVRDEVAAADRRMADMPISSWSSSMVSHIRAVGSSQVLVFVDGSEAMLDSYTLERLPSDIGYRAGYDRD